MADATVDFRKKLGRLLASYRKACGKLQEEVGEEIGCSRSRVSTWERGSHAMRMDQADGFLAACGVSWKRLGADLAGVPSLTLEGILEEHLWVREQLEAQAELIGRLRSQLAEATDRKRA